MGNEVALEVLAMAARGRIPGALLDELAAVVLDRPDVQLAQAIAKGGKPRRTRRDRARRAVARWR